jgi:hypothetical protein
MADLPSLQAAKLHSTSSNLLAKSPEFTILNNIETAPSLTNLTRLLCIKLKWYNAIAESWRALSLSAFNACINGCNAPKTPIAILF